MMENNSSCLLWGVGLYTPVDLGSVFSINDLEGEGVQLDSHITVLYAGDKLLPRESMMEDISTILGEEKFSEFISYCKDEQFRNVFDLFELDKFSNDSDYVILKLKKNNEFFGILNLLNKGLRTKYRVSSDFDGYTPHITLAELRKGEANKYLATPELHQILADSKVDFEDLIFSIPQDDDWKQFFLTNFKNVDRFFRIEELKKYNKEVLNSEGLI